MFCLNNHFRARQSKLLHFICLPLMSKGKSMGKVISLLPFNQIPIYLNDRSLGKQSGDFLFNYPRLVYIVSRSLDSMLTYESHMGLSGIEEA